MTPVKVGKQVRIVSYYSPEAMERLKGLSESTRVPQAAYLREALDDVLHKHGWRKLIPGCFGMMDANFAIHPADTERAKQAIATAKEAGATFEDFEKEIVWYCYKEVTAPDLLQKHVAKQVTRAKRLWGK
jgi:Ribbon-helix-helix domain